MVDSKSDHIRIADREKPGLDVVDDDPTIDIRSLQYTAKYDHLTCPICQQPFVKPYTTICGHTFCRSCLLEALRSPMGSKCPLDRTPLKYEESDESGTPNGNDDVFPAPIIISNIADDLQVKCLNVERGCEWKGPRWQIRSHLLHNCKYTRFVCGREGVDGEQCGLLAEQRFLGEPTNGGKCPHIEFPCDKCEEQVSLVDLEWHLQNECEENMVTCHGCSLEFPVKDLEEHEKYCEKVHIRCPAARFGCDWRGSRELLEKVHQPGCVFTKLSGYLEGQESHMKAIVHENEFLRKEMDYLLDGVMQGRLVNLGSVVEEIPRHREDSMDSSGSGSMNADFEELQLGVQRAKRALTDLEVNKRVVGSLVGDSAMMKEELSNQRMALNSLRQQLQYVMSRTGSGRQQTSRL